MFQQLRRWFQPGQPVQDAPAIPVVLYSRAGCHLCDAAWKVLHAAQRRFPLALTVVDIDSDADLAARFGPHVPVVSVNGTVRFRGCVSGPLLRRLLQAEAGRRS